MMRDVVVIGGGVSGLAAAHALARRGVDVQLLERQVCVGGNARSQAFDGYLMELGPTTLNAAFAPAMEVVQELGLGKSRVGLGAGVRKRYLRDGEKLFGISTHPLGFFLSPYLSLRARASLIAEILRPAKTGKAEETVHQFVSRRFGPEFADKVLEPMAAGIFMGDSHRLSIGGAFPKLAQMEARHGSVVRGVLAARRGQEPGRQLFSWPGGIGSLPAALASRLGERVQIGAAVRKIRRHKRGFEIETAQSGTLSARAIIIAVQPHVAAALLEDVDATTSMAAGAIEAPPVGVVFFGFERAQVAHPLDGLGFLSTRRQGDLITGTQFCSTMFPGRAPRGHVSIACYIGGARNPDLARAPGPEIISQVQEELSGLLGISRAPRVARVHFWPRGLPQYNLGHGARQETLGASHLRVPGLFVTGNYLNGVSVSNCLHQAGVVAKQVATWLGRQSDTAGKIDLTKIKGQ